MVRLTRFGVVRTASVAAFVYVIMSAIIVIPIALIVSTTPVTVTDQFGQPVTMRLSPIFLFLPLVYGALGWVFTAIACLIYNLAAWMTGGIEFEAVPVAAQAPPACMPPPAAPPTTPAAPPPAAPGAP